METNNPILHPAIASSWKTLTRFYPHSDFETIHLDTAAEKFDATAISLLKGARAAACCEVVGGYIYRKSLSSIDCNDCPLKPVCSENL